jgi:phosphoenolpyruvate carboxykinase (ATP)
MSIRHTRALLAAALDGSLARAKFSTDPFFGLLIPDAVPGVPSEVLDPRNSWADKADYDRTAQDLIARFEKNFASFEAGVTEDVKAAAIRVAA